jgi:hypothetical protein
MVTVLFITLLISLAINIYLYILIDQYKDNIQDNDILYKSIRFDLDFYRGKFDAAIERNDVIISLIKEAGFKIESIKYPEERLIKIKKTNK